MADFFLIVYCTWVIASVERVECVSLSSVLIISSCISILRFVIIVIVNPRPKKRGKRTTTPA